MLKTIDAGLLRSKVHEMIYRTAKENKPLSPYGKGFIDALAKVEALIDKMRPVTAQQFNLVQNGAGTVIGEMHGDITIDFREKKTVTMKQEAKEIYNIRHVEEMRV